MPDRRPGEPDERELARRLALMRGQGVNTARLLDRAVNDGLMDARLSRRVEEHIIDHPTSR